MSWPMPVKRIKLKLVIEAKVLNIDELAAYLHIHRSTIYRLLKKGELPGFKLGSDWRFNVEAIDAWRFTTSPRKS
jgi:excisionase family DNA binding protein